MSKKFPAFHGKVTSKSGFCVANRTILLYRERRGAGAVDIVLGESMSRSNGGWKIKVNNLGSGVYYSFAPKRASASLGIPCRAGRSKIVVVDRSRAGRCGEHRRGLRPDDRSPRWC